MKTQVTCGEEVTETLEEWTARMNREAPLPQKRPPAVELYFHPGEHRFIEVPLEEFFRLMAKERVDPLA